jgi:hypothetical protein
MTMDNKYWSAFALNFMLNIWTAMNNIDKIATGMNVSCDKLLCFVPIIDVPKNNNKIGKISVK